MTQRTASRLDGQIRLIVAQELELDPAELTETASFVDDYDADSLSLIQVFARIERELGMSIPQNEMPNMTDLRAIHTIVERYTDGESAGG